LPIAMIVESQILLTHLTPPRNATGVSVSEAARERNRIAGAVHRGGAGAGQAEAGYCG
jgi:hypothetical protein